MIINKLRDRRYPEYILERAVNKIQEVTGTELLTPRTCVEGQRIRYIISFNPSNPDMKSIALQHLHLLARMRRNPITQGQSTNSLQEVKKSERIDNHRNSECKGSTHILMLTL